MFNSRDHVCRSIHPRARKKTLSNAIAPLNPEIRKKISDSIERIVRDAHSSRVLLGLYIQLQILEAFSNKPIENWAGILTPIATQSHIYSCLSVINYREKSTIEDKELKKRVIEFMAK